jgi:hypothetical protein
MPHDLPLPDNILPQMNERRFDPLAFHTMPQQQLIQDIIGL